MYAYELVWTQVTSKTTMLCHHSSDEEIAEALKGLPADQLAKLKACKTPNPELSLGV